MLSRDRCILEEVCLSVRNDTGELLLFFIDPMKHGRGGEKLEGATERKALARPVLETPATTRLERSDTQSSTETPFDRFYARSAGGITALARRRRIARDEKQSEEKPL